MKKCGLASSSGSVLPASQGWSCVTYRHRSHRNQGTSWSRCSRIVRGFCAHCALFRARVSWRPVTKSMKPLESCTCSCYRRLARTHQITLGLPLQLLSVFIEDRWLHPKEREGLWISWEIRVLFDSTAAFLSHPNLIIISTETHAHMIILFLKLLFLNPSDWSLTAEPGFSGVAAGSGVRTWPPCRGAGLHYHP